MYLCAQNHDLKRGGTFETAKAGTFHSVTAGTSIPLFTNKKPLRPAHFIPLQPVHRFRYLQINKRSSIRSGDIDWGQVGLESYNSINHDNLHSWQRVITNYKRHYSNGFVYY